MKQRHQTYCPIPGREGGQAGAHRRLLKTTARETERKGKEKGMAGKARKRGKKSVAKYRFGEKAMGQSTRMAGRNIRVKI